MCVSIYQSMCVRSCQCEYVCVCVCVFVNVSINACEKQKTKKEEYFRDYTKDASVSMYSISAEPRRTANKLSGRPAVSVYVSVLSSI